MKAAAQTQNQPQNRKQRRLQAAQLKHSTFSAEPQITSTNTTDADGILEETEDFQTQSYPLKTSPVPQPSSTPPPSSNPTPVPAQKQEPALSLQELIELEQIVSLVKMVEIGEMNSNGEINYDAVTHFQRARIQEALAAVHNLKTAKLFAENHVTILLSTFEMIKNLAKETEVEENGIIFYSIQTTEKDKSFHFIFLDKNMFKSWNKEAEQDLRVKLAGEAERISIFLNQPEANRYDHPDRSFLPWPLQKSSFFSFLSTEKNAEQHQTRLFISAYAQYVNRVKYYDQLIIKSDSHVSLTPQEKTDLEQFDEAILTYIPPRFGKYRHTEIQEGCLKKEDGSITCYKNVEETEPSFDQPQARLNYLRKAFILSCRNQEVKYAAYRHLKTSEEKIYNQMIREVNYLSPPMRKIFTPEFCEIGNRYFNEENHCDRPGWREIR